MPRRKFIDKKNASTFALVYRPQSDPLIHDADAPDVVFHSVDAPNTHKAGSSSRANKATTRNELEHEFGDGGVRANEGEAANYGVYFDDSGYDYMQHLRDLGSGGGEMTFVEAPSSQRQRKGKGKAKLEDALRDMELDERRPDVEYGQTEESVEDVLEEHGRAPKDDRPSYQHQQDVPDAIAGFQPDLDPRLREVLEALEDDAYVDDEDDVFAALAGTAGGEEMEQYQWEGLAWEDEEDGGWETDDTVTPTAGERKQRRNKVHAQAAPPPTASDTDTIPHNDAATADHGDGAWLASFHAGPHPSSTPLAPPSDLPSKLTGTSSLFGGRRKKRKGALTSSAGGSMTSSALGRTSGQALLDARFDRLVEEEYGEDEWGEGAFDDGASAMSGMSGMSRISGVSRLSGVSRASRASGVSRASGFSKASGGSRMSSASAAPRLVGADFDDAALDGFLQGYDMRKGKAGGRSGRARTGVEQLDDLRKELGPARLRAQKA